MSRKSDLEFLTLTQMDTGVIFGHRNDERAFFEWLGRIPCVEKYVGEGRRGLVVYLKRPPRKDELRELLALCHRYHVEMRQLARFETAWNRHWFHRSDAYWYEAVFGSGHKVLDLAEEAKKLSDLLTGKRVKIIQRYRSREALIEFEDGTRLFIDNIPSSLEFSVTDGREEE